MYRWFHFHLATPSANPGQAACHLYIPRTGGALEWVNREVKAYSTEDAVFFLIFYFMYHLDCPRIISLAVLLLNFIYTITAVPTSDLLSAKGLVLSRSHKPGAVEPLRKIDPTAPSNFDVSKRTVPGNFYAANLPPELRNFALEHGWSMTISYYSVIWPLANGAVRNVRATRMLGALFTHVQTLCAAHMLNSTPYQPQFSFRFGKTELVFQVSPALHS